MRRQAANPINLKGVDVIITNEIASAFIRFKKAWDDHYVWQEEWQDTWVAFEDWNPEAAGKLVGTGFNELVSDFLYGLSGKTIGDFLRNKNIEFSPDWKVDSIFQSTKIILAPYTDFRNGQYYSPNDGKPFIFINPWLIWEGLPRFNSETAFKKVLKNFLGHELIHALDWAYRYKQKSEDKVFDPNKPEQENAYYNSPHELKAYVYTIADLIWNQTLPMNRTIQRWNGEALYKHIFSNNSMGDKIEPKHRKVFIQRVVKQLEMFKQEWIKEQERKKGKSPKVSNLNLLKKAPPNKEFYSSYNGRVISLDTLLDSEEEKGNKVTQKLKALSGKNLEGLWAADSLEGAAVYAGNWSRDEIEEGLVTREEIEEELNLSPLNLEGWLYDPDMNDGDGGNIYIKPKSSTAKKSSTEEDETLLKEAKNRLAFAAIKGDLTEVKSVVESGLANQSILNIGLELAARYTQKDVLLYLLDKGATDGRGNSLCGLLQKPHLNKDDSLEMLGALLKAGSDIDASGGFPLRIAVDEGFTEAAEMLVENGADVMANDNYPLRISCQKGDMRLVEVLLKHGADPNRNDGEALLEAGNEGYSDVLQLLMAYGGDEEFIKDSLSVKAKRTLFILKEGVEAYKKFHAQGLESRSDMPNIDFVYNTSTNINSTHSTDLELLQKLRSYLNLSVTKKAKLKRKIKKAAYSEVDEDFCLRHNIDPEELGWLGAGGIGNAYQIDSNRVLKITSSRNEYDLAKSLIGKKFDNLVEFYVAEKVGSDYYIIMERVKMDHHIEYLFYEVQEILETQGLPVNFMGHFNEDDYIETHGEIPEDVKKFMDELEGLIFELIYRAGIGDTADIHPGNLGRDKNTGALKAFDLMEKN